MKRRVLLCSGRLFLVRSGRVLEPCASRAISHACGTLLRGFPTTAEEDERLVGGSAGGGGDGRFAARRELPARAAK